MFVFCFGFWFVDCFIYEGCFVVREGCGNFRFLLLRVFVGVSFIGWLEVMVI